MENAQEFKNFGYANGWAEKPERIKICEEKKHTLVIENIGRCLTSYHCPICNYSYKVDSSG